MQNVSSEYILLHCLSLVAIWKTSAGVSVDADFCTGFVSINFAEETGFRIVNCTCVIKYCCHLLKKKIAAQVLPETHKTIEIMNYYFSCKIVIIKCGIETQVNVQENATISIQNEVVIWMRAKLMTLSRLFWLGFWALALFHRHGFTSPQHNVCQHIHALAHCANVCSCACFEFKVLHFDCN